MILWRNYKSIKIGAKIWRSPGFYSRTLLILHEVVPRLELNESFDYLAVSEADLVLHFLLLFVFALLALTFRAFLVGGVFEHLLAVRFAEFFLIWLEFGFTVDSRN